MHILWVNGLWHMYAVYTVRRLNRCCSPQQKAQCEVMFSIYFMLNLFGMNLVINTVFSARAIVAL